MTLELTVDSTLPGFAELGVPAPLVSALATRGIVSPFPIQRATIADSLAGSDVLGRGRTGSGKTVAFAVPMVVRLASSTAGRTPMSPRGLILVPTRELATQVLEVVTPLARTMNLRALAIVGGVRQGAQVAGLRRGADIVVATPGRLEDLMRQRIVRLDAVKVTVLDEADHMADLGFLPAVRRILDATPDGGQRLLFSATIDASVDVLVRRYLSTPIVHSVDEESSPVPAMEHHVINVAPLDKPAVIRELVSGQNRTIAFTRTRHGARKLAKQLSVAGVRAVDLHGDLSQAARSRNLEAFTRGEARVLVATDIAARGIHVDDVALVVHVDPPEEHKAYLHRSGRTARAGAEGVVVTIGLPHQRADVDKLMKRASITATRHTVAPGDAVLSSFAANGSGAEARSAGAVRPAAAIEGAADRKPARRRPRHRRAPRGRA